MASDQLLPLLRRTCWIGFCPRLFRRRKQRLVGRRRLILCFGKTYLCWNAAVVLLFDIPTHQN